MHEWQRSSADLMISSCTITLGCESFIATHDRKSLWSLQQSLSLSLAVALVLALQSGCTVYRISPARAVRLDRLILACLLSSTARAIHCDLRPVVWMSDERCGKQGQEDNIRPGSGTIQSSITLLVAATKWRLHCMKAKAGKLLRRKTRFLGFFWKKTLKPQKPKF